MTRPLALSSLALLILTACGDVTPTATEQSSNDKAKNAQQRVHQKLEQDPFYKQQITSQPLLPANLSEPYIQCPLSSSQSGDYKSSEQVDYSQPGWEQRIAADWDYFDSSEEAGRILVIDFQQRDQSLAYRYLANANTQDDLYEPWSTSKIMAITGAVSKAREHGVGARSLAGGVVPVPDLITSINSYAPFGQANGNSNSIATYLVNAAGRDYLTSLFHDNWLKLSNDNVSLRGAYYREVFNPGEDLWLDPETGKTAPMPTLESNSDDPGYRDYRCDDCGLTGNKPMTTLAQAEWLKRLASHQQDKATRHPNLTAEDVQTLFYGTGHSDEQHQYGGMLQGISRMLTHALAKGIDADTQDPKATLDKSTDGQWRIFQKIGWGPSGTRGRSEVVILAQVCLPEYQGGKAFTLAAQSSVEGNDEALVSNAGQKLQKLMTHSLEQYLNR
ncbi:hypothetical protein HMF8227_01130 [Saliniradius amylolyticus]|uniref:Serine hydrolase n=1 Tax=Saliniradius amylolyticus TaxID=2183582 RepID=A0A2S2E1T6_9ALTE|nr:hypothetical protein [Saliniradius amylolyticus]AWL11611.1 hypothetical protein HMF8227_01130 [Saliniradius amylolyticus]